MEDPWALLRRLKLGREEFCQRLLTMLILEADYPRWNTKSRPSTRGQAFLRDLDALCFGASDLSQDVVFVDEFDLPPRVEGERGGAPDYAVIDGERLWMIELKTEVASHRPAQLPSYFEYAQHHHPRSRVDLAYVAPHIAGVSVPAPDGARFAYVTWQDVAPLLAHWDGAPDELRRTREALDEALAGIGSPWTSWREGRIDDPVATALALAERTQSDGQQRALDYPFGSLDEMLEVRLQVRDALARRDSSARPWRWSAQSSGGRALTATGEQVGFELRLSQSQVDPT